MAEQRLQEYVDYYRVRAAKYESSPMYAESARCERALLDAFESSATLEEARARVEQGELTLATARALVRDQEQARIALYERLDEPVRASVSRAVLHAVDDAQDPVALANAVSRARTEAQTAVLVDELHRSFEDDVVVLEDLQALQEADVPPEWRVELEREAAELTARTGALWRDARLPSARRWDPRWTFDYGTLTAARHRRRLPFTDGYLEHLMERHRTEGWV